MNRCGKIIFCLIGGLALTASIHADNTTLPGDPYATVVSRNVFGLNPPPPPGPQVPADPPAKIIPNGIMSILGQLQVLFKVPGTAKPGAPAVDQSYILSEGQRQDDIEVVKIDEGAGIVTFNNHGETQVLPLVVTQPSATAATAAATAAPGGAPRAPGTTPGAGPGAHFSPGLVNPGGGAGLGGGVRPGGIGNGDGSTSVNPNNNTALGNVPTRNPTYVQQPSVDPATQTIMIEANRLQAQQQGDPAAKLYPITQLTPQLDSENGDGVSQQQ